MWGDVGMSTDIRFYGVAPHWYFRPYMAWLIVCPSHRPGLFGLVYFFVIIFYQPNINGTYETKEYKTSISFFSTPLVLLKKYKDLFSTDSNSKKYTINVNNTEDAAKDGVNIVQIGTEHTAVVINKYTFKVMKSSVEYTIFYQFTFGIFIMCIFYTTTFLPYGRFYNRLGGNIGMLASYLYIFLYLGSSFLKRNWYTSITKNNVYNSLTQIS
jgi:hypothetical protein